MSKTQEVQPGEAPTARPSEGDGAGSASDLSPAPVDAEIGEGLMLEVPGLATLAADDPDEADTPPEATPAERFSPLQLKDRVAIMLLFYEVASLDQVERAWRKWRKRGRNVALWRVVAEEPEVDRDRLFQVVAQVYAFPEARIAKGATVRFVQSQKQAFGERQWRQMGEMGLLPIGQEVEPQTKERVWVFATHDPTRPEVASFLTSLGLGRYDLRFAPESLITDVIARAFPRRNEYLDRVRRSDLAVDLGSNYRDEERLIDEDALEAEISRSNLINLFEATLVEAVRRGASDVHVFPNAQRRIEIHFRVDGELELWHEEERVHPEAFLAVIKDNCVGVDRFERDVAQDGALQRWIDDALIRFRVSVLPLAGAAQELRSESIVIRVLDDRKVIERIEDLGLAGPALKSFQWALRQPHGMVILTGPTGSGKSTTLFAALKTVVTPKKNALTVEDPVEYLIPGVRQVKLGHKLGFEGALRSILRHDPDIVMVGEMRDRQTAEVAVKLANTGHLTFSTLHTNDAPSAVARLYKMGVEPFLIAYAINLIVAQRLLRKLCPTCKRPDPEPDVDLLLDLGFSDDDILGHTFYAADQVPECPTCGGTGYKGRQAITETLRFTTEIRKLITRAGAEIDEDRLREQATADGMGTLQESARALVLQGLTSVEELMRSVAT